MALPPFHGIALSIGALRTEKSAGIGEYPDLLPLIDGLASLGMNSLQLLPINDSGQDPSPYNGLSAFALHPIFLRIPGFNAKELDSQKRIDYEGVLSRKKEALRLQFQREFDSLKSDPAYLQFLEEQKEWIFEWAQFQEGAFSLYEQYLCFSQMKEAVDHAKKKGVLLIGDLPILLSPASADCKFHPRYFSQDFVAGAPPDMFNKEGQKWGFPLWRWDVLEKEHFSFWKKRIHWANQFFGTFRLDHIVGFFRIWAIPQEKSAKEGFYIPSEKEKWLEQGKMILHSLLSICNMAPLGEDLGVIPDEVRAAMQALQIPSMKVIRWERRWNRDKSYIPYSDYPELSLTCVSTHDTEPLRSWWQNQPEERRAFCTFKHWKETPTLDSAKILEILHDSHKTKSRFHSNLLLEYMSAFPELSYENPEEDRINIPGTVSPFNWGWRMRPTLEELFSHQNFTSTLSSLLR